MNIPLLVVGGVAILVVGIAVGYFFNRENLTLDRVTPVIYLAVTLGAVGLVFIFGPAAVWNLLDKNTPASIEHAEDIFSTITHIGAIVITYWVASRNGGRGIADVHGNQKREKED